MDGEVERLRIVFDADGRPYIAGLRHLDRETNTTTSRMGKAWSTYGRVAGVAIMGVAVVAGAALARLAKDSVKAASDMNETMSKSAKVFGESQGKMVSWGATAAKAFGLSKQKALESAASLGLLLKVTDAGQDSIAGMSQELVQRAADLGSIHNMGTADVLEAIRSGLVGESEPMRKFAVTLNEARLKQEALNMGLYKGKGALSDQAKMMAAYKVILEDTTYAQGDFKDTADGVANSTKTLGSMWADAQADLGQKLIPTLQQFIQIAQDGLPAVVQSATTLLGVVAALAQAWLDVWSNFGRYYDEVASDEEKSEKRARELAAKGSDTSAIQQAKAKDSTPFIQTWWDLDNAGGGSGSAYHPNQMRNIQLPIDLDPKVDEKQLSALAWNIGVQVTNDMAGSLQENASTVADALTQLYQTDPTAAADEAARLYIAAVRRKLTGVGGIFGQILSSGGGGGDAEETNDHGGFLPPGMSIAVNKTGKPEPVLNPAQTGQLMSMGPVLDALERQLGSLGQNIGQLASKGGTGGGQTIIVADSSSIDRAAAHGERFARL